METFYLLCAIPLTIAIIAKFFFHHSITWTEFAIQAVAGVLILAGVYFAGTYSAMADNEIINGQVTNKVRDHGHYIESYSCNCRSVRSGNTTTTRCDTCYRDHYTVDWYLESTIGRISIDSADWTSRAVYALPNPSRYTQAKIGEHCSKTSSYTNYIKATPESIFHSVGALDKSLLAMVPEYPRVHDIYRKNSVVTVGIKRDANIEQLDRAINDSLKTLGAKKQVNVNVVIARTNKEMFSYVLERQWIGGKKNDVTVVIGAPEYPKISWVSAFTIANSADNNMLTVSLRNALLDMKTLENPNAVAGTITTNVEKHFKRKSMKDFEYLKDEIEPPVWVIVISIILSIAIGCGLTCFFHYNEIGGTRRRRYY